MLSSSTRTAVARDKLANAVVASKSDQKSRPKSGTCRESDPPQYSFPERRGSPREPDVPKVGIDFREPLPQYMGTVVRVSDCINRWWLCFVDVGCASGTTALVSPRRFRFVFTNSLACRACGPRQGRGLRWSRGRRIAASTPVIRVRGQIERRCVLDRPAGGRRDRHENRRPIRV
jgi:hypothetical protein